MDLQSRKINLVNRLLDIDNDQVINSIEDIFAEIAPKYDANTKIDYKGELLARAEISNDQIATNKVISHKQLKQTLNER